MFLYILLWMIGVNLNMPDEYFIIDAICIGLGAIKTICGLAKFVLEMTDR